MYNNVESITFMLQMLPLCFLRVIRFINLSVMFDDGGKIIQNHKNMH